MYSDLKERIMPFLREMDDIYSGSNQKIITILDEYEEKMKVVPGRNQKRDKGR